MEVSFILKGVTPILFHADDVEASDELKLWRDDPRNKNISVAGDDRSPAWTWQTYLYTDGGQLAIPYDNLMSCLRKAGAKLIMKRQTTFKEATQNGIIPTGEYCQFQTGGKSIEMKQIAKLRDRSFKDQADAVRDLGFRLFVKRAKVGQAKHVRVRARFDSWTVTGTVALDDAVPEMSFDVACKIFEIAGRVGLLDWRPGSPKSPGSFGMFEATLKKVG